MPGETYYLANYDGAWGETTFEACLEMLPALWPKLDRWGRLSLGLYNSDRVDQGFDGLTDDEREAFEEAKGRAAGSPAPTRSEGIQEAGTEGVAQPEPERDRS